MTAKGFRRLYSGARGDPRVCACGCGRVFVAYDRRRKYFDVGGACKQAAYRDRKRAERRAGDGPAASL